MRPSNKNRFAKLTEQVRNAASDVVERPKPAEKPANRRTPVLAKRDETAKAVSDRASGKVRHIKVFGHSPARIRPWHGHNRDYQALSKERCQDLIEGFRRAGQQFPAVVRKVKDSDDFDYEFVCGARRHWTSSYLERDLLIEVRDLDDRAAFLLQDIENRDREDISDYERAVDYSKALPVYFDNKKSHMAEQLQIDPGNFNRFLALADLPTEIVDAYGDIRDLVTHHGTVYTSLLKDSASKKKVLDKAKSLHGKGATGKEVLGTLKDSVIAGKAASTVASKPMKKGRLTIKTSKSGNCVVNFKVPKTDRQKGLLEIRRDFMAVLDELETMEQ